MVIEAWCYSLHLSTAAARKMKNAREATINPVANCHPTYPPGVCMFTTFWWCGKRGQARELYEASLSRFRSAGHGDDVGNYGGGYSHIYSGDEELTSMFLVATAVVPALYASNGHIAQVDVRYERGHGGGGGGRCIVAALLSLSLLG